MTVLDTRTTEAPADSRPLAGVRGALGGVTALLLAGGLLVVVAGWHLTQGTSGIGAGDLWDLVRGSGDSDTRDVLVASRLPRLLAGLAVGLCLGLAGALFQSLCRNALASPDTLAVNAGAYFAIALSAVLGISLPVLGGSAVAFLGGLLAAGLVMAMSGGGSSSTTRLVLAGSALAIALGSATSALQLLFEQDTLGLFFWGGGTLTQLDLTAFTQTSPVLAVSVVAALALSRRLDLLALGDDTAHVLGIRVRRTRIVGTVIAVLLSSIAVSLAGPIGFVGLCAPTIVRLAARVVPGVARHAVLLPLSGLAGAILVLLADALMRLLLTPESALLIPTGVTTTMLGAVVLVVLGRSARDAGAIRQPPAARAGTRYSRLRLVVVVSSAAALMLGSTLAGLMLGYTKLLPGDLLYWVQGRAVPLVGFALDERAPRVAAALLAGAALALAGTMVQAVARNPLAEPGLIGVTAGGGVGAIVAVTTFASPSTWQIALAAAIGSLLAFAIVYLASWRGGLDSSRLVLVGIGIWSGGTALTTFVIVRSNPWDVPRALTWLSGSTFDRQWPQVVPVLVAVAVALPLAWLLHRELDLLALDEDTPRLAGIRLERVRLLVLLVAALLAAMAVSAAGVVGFVGLVAPHAARALIGGRHLRVVPVSVLLGAALLSVADTIGRTVIAPGQVPAGLVVAVIGAPYFIYLLWRTRA